MNSTQTAGKKMKHKVFLVDDHPIVRQGLTQLINQETDFTVCGDAAEIQETLNAVSNCRPDTVIVDITLEQGNGIRLMEELIHRHPGLLILALSMHDETVYAERCLRAGAKGYVMKQEPPEKVISALRQLVKGEIYISDRLSSKLLHKYITKQTEGSKSAIERLSNRELEVFQLIGSGLKTRDIANELNLSVKTIETYIDHIKKKMNFESSRELILRAVQWQMGKE